MLMEIKMPSLSEKMETGTLCMWNVSAGDEVSQGDVLCEIEYNKVTCELEAECDMKILTLAVEEGDEIPVGKVILVSEAAIQDGGK